MKQISIGRAALQMGAALLLTSISAFAQYSSPIHDVDNPARQPVHFSADGEFTVTLATVPANKRLVIEFASVACSGTSGLIYFVIGDGTPYSNGLLLSPPSTHPGIMSQSVRVYVSAGSSLTMNAVKDPGYGCQFNAVGYYVNLP